MNMVKTLICQRNEYKSDEQRASHVYEAADLTDFIQT
mgnify:FL=1